MFHPRQVFNAMGDANPIERGPARGVPQVACRNFKMSCVSVLSRLHNTVGNLATYIWLRQSFVAISFERCRYFLAHVACRNLPWQGLLKWQSHSFLKTLLDAKQEA